MIIFTKNGIFYENGMSQDSEDYVYKQVDSVIPYLSDIIEFDDRLTFRDFFALLEPDEKMIELVFGSHMGHYPLRPFLDEVLNDGVPDGREDMDYISCSWTAEQFDYNLFYEKNKGEEDSENSFIKQMGIELHEPTEDDENEVSIYANVHGWGKYAPNDDEDEDEDDDNEEDVSEGTSYAIEFTPLNRIAHLPLKLDNRIEIRDRNEVGNEDPLIDGIMYFSVFEAIGAILSEITFCGLPEDRNAKWQEIVDEVDNVKKKFTEDDFDDEDYDDEDEDDDYDYDGE